MRMYHIPICRYDNCNIQANGYVKLDTKEYYVCAKHLTQWPNNIKYDLFGDSWKD